MNFILRPLIITAVVLWLISAILPGVDHGNWVTLLLASLAILLLYKVVKPIVSLLLLPINIVTLGLFAGFLNVGLLWAATALIPGFHIDPMTIAGWHLNQFWSLMVVSFLLSFGGSLLSLVI